MSLSMKGAAVPALWAEAHIPPELELCHWQSFSGGTFCPLPLQPVLKRHWQGFWLNLPNRICPLLQGLTSWINCSPWATDPSCQALFVTEILGSHTLSLSHEFPGAIWRLRGSCSVFSSSTENIPFQFTTKCGLVQLKMAWSLIRWGWWVGVSRPSCHVRCKNRNCLLQSAFAILYW